MGRPKQILVSIEWPVDTDNGERVYEVEAKVTPGYPGDFHGPVETACAPEPADVDISQIRLRGTVLNIDAWLKENEVDTEMLYEALLEEADAVQRGDYEG